MIAEDWNRIRFLVIIGETDPSPKGLGNWEIVFLHSFKRFILDLIRWFMSYFSEE